MFIATTPTTSSSCYKSSAKEEEERPAVKNRPKKEIRWEEIEFQEGEGFQSLTKEDKRPKVEWENSRIERKKREEEKRKRERRVNASCFLTGPIFNQHCLCSSNNHRKLARLDTHWVWMALLILARVSPAVLTHPVISWAVFPSENERRRKDRAASILFLMTGYPLCLSVCVSASSLSLDSAAILTPLKTWHPYPFPSSYMTLSNPLPPSSFTLGSLFK